MELEKKPHEICAQNELQDLSKYSILWHLAINNLFSSLFCASVASLKDIGLDIKASLIICNASTGDGSPNG